MIFESLNMYIGLFYGGKLQESESFLLCLWYSAFLKSKLALNIAVSVNFSSFNFSGSWNKFKDFSITASTNSVIQFVFLYFSRRTAMKLRVTRCRVSISVSLHQRVLSATVSPAISSPMTKHHVKVKYYDHLYWAVKYSVLSCLVLCCINDLNVLRIKLFAVSEYFTDTRLIVL